MPIPYQKKYNLDGTLNDHYRPRNPAWKKQPSGKSGKSGKSGRHRSKFERATFVGWDGEGGDYNGRHIYNLFACSDGTSVYKESGLSSVECFEYILERARNQPKATVNVIYGGSYDANMWLRDVPKDRIKEMSESDGKFYTYWNGYELRYMPRKYFAIRKYGEKNSVVIWDVIGFFQSTFVSAIKQWLPAHESTELIISGKAQRSSFTASDIDYVKEYCRAELVCLVEIMNKLRDAVEDLGLSLRRWDGAGAVAVAFLQKYNVKEYFDTLPDPVQEAAQHAYFGGRIEIGKYGRHDGMIYHYDINSAYPSIQAQLPALAGGRWVRRGAGFDCRTTDNLMVISRVKWSWIDNTAFCPFPYRSSMQQKVLFPALGENWIWKPELAAAMDVNEEQHRNWIIDVFDSWEFIPSDDTKPFHWVAENYEERKRIVAESKKTGIPNGMEKVIKLGLNSLYGKTAQKAGYDESTGRKPPYHNIAYAGYITSATRAKLWRAAMQANDKIIALATDGIYSTVPLDLDCPPDKVLGLWEAQEHDEMVLVQAGFYWIRDGEKLKAFSRGFDKMTSEQEKRETLDIVLNAWKQRQYELRLPCTRFITMRTALVSDVWWDRWCTWHEMEKDGVKGRRLQITCEGTKRVSKGEYNRPHLKMIQTEPVINLSDDMSEKYTLPWDIEGDVNATEIDKEHTESYL